jgi:hypothetical protein
MSPDEEACGLVCDAAEAALGLDGLEWGRTRG